MCVLSRAVFPETGSDARLHRATTTRGAHTVAPGAPLAPGGTGLKALQRRRQAAVAQLAQPVHRL